MSRTMLVDDASPMQLFDRLEEAVFNGWELGTYSDGWVKMRHPEKGMIALGVLDDIEPDRFPLAASQDVAAELGRWQDAMGAPWFGTPGVAGLDALEARVRAVRTYRADWKPGRQDWQGAAESAYTLRQFDRRAEDASPYLHGYDVTRMYATAAGTVEVSPQELRRTGAVDFDPARAGWWRVEVSHWPAPALPDPAGYARSKPRGWRWVTTPTLTLLRQLHEEGGYGGFTVLDSWTGPGRRLFREWNAGLESLYAAGTPAMRTAVKAAGRETVGLLNSPTCSSCRPDWHYAIVAQARVNLWRKLRKALNEHGRRPLAIDTDCVWYGSDVADPIAAAPPNFQFGDTPGGFKVKGSVTR